MGKNKLCAFQSDLKTSKKITFANFFDLKKIDGKIKNSYPV